MAYHRTTSGTAILENGFRDAETLVGGELHQGVWITLERPWDEAVASLPAGEDRALLVIDVPDELVAPFEWVQEDADYREALVPAEVLNQYRVYRAWECDGCGAIAAENTPGWGRDARLRIRTCADCTDARVTGSR